jgi:hypothetical protein
VKRIWLLGPIVAALLVIGGATALAATPHAKTVASTKSKTTKSTKPTKVVTNLTCKSNLTLLVPTGDVTVTQGATSGTQAGRASCGGSQGAGIERQTFTSDAGGTLSGAWQQWFNSGTLYGTFTMTPDESGPPTTTSFTSASYTGKVVVKAGTGTDRKTTGAGTVKCSTADDVHYVCTETVKLLQVIPAKG